MSIVRAIIAGTIGAVVGYVVALAAGLLFATATGMSNFEGAAGMFAAFAVGPVGGLIGLILGIVLVLRRSGTGRSLGGIAWRGLLAVAAIVALVAGGIGLMYLSDDVLNRNGAAPRLMFDLRLPAGATADIRAMTVELHTDKNTGSGILFNKSERRDGERMVVSGSAELYFRTAQRLLVVKTRGQQDRVFRLKLPARPSHMRTPGEWQRPDTVAGAGAEPSRPGADYELRYRVAWAGED